MSCKKNAIRRGTTPGFLVEVEGDITAYDIWLTFKSAGVAVTRTDDTLEVEYDAEKDVTSITCRLTQEETLSFGVGMCEVQIRAAKDGGTDAIATDIGSIESKRILLDGVIGSDS